MADDEPWLSPDQLETWMAYLRGTSIVELAVDRHLRADAGLTHPEYEILTRLSSAPEQRLRMGQLADRVVAPKSRLSNQIDKLASRGLVERRQSLDDGRGVEAILTDEGLALLREVAPEHARTVRSALVDRLDAVEIAQLGAIMRKLAD